MVSMPELILEECAYIEVVDQVGADGQVDPGVFCNHGGTIR